MTLRIDCGISLQATGVWAGYDADPVLHDVNVALRQGEVLAIIGPNGCGKSTLLRCLVRLHQCQQGAVLLDGSSLDSLPTRHVARRVAFLPQEATAPPGLTVRELVSFGRHPHRQWFRADEAGQAIVEEAMKETGIAALAGRPVQSLSGGQRQRAWIGLALAQGTDYLLLDEPTTFLDPAHQVDVMDLVHRLNRRLGKTIALVMHDLSLAARYADRIVCMKDGRVLISGRPDEVMNRDILRQMYGVEMRVFRDKSGRIIACTPWRQLHEGGSAP